jgi:peptidoglycan/LPS O-acetylase OafA/YrhL
LSTLTQDEHARSAPDPAKAAAGSAGFRTDVQALRAVAVMAVVVNHIWPSRLAGGYVGVDVFFVISGFLISSHLGREIIGTGRLRLGRFYARRVRRLLPAAFLVLAFCIVAAYLLLPYPQWEANAWEVFASATYWENWLLAAKSVDYSALNAAASVTQHYWSLSVEEQFYLCWPLLLLLLFKLKGRWALGIGITVVGAASLAYGVYLTAADKSPAYFVTPVRVWEFAIGALIALLGTKALPKLVAGLGSLVGFVMIIGSAVVFDHHTEFPGAMALIPAVGTGLVILAGTGRDRQWHSVVTALPPVQWLGNISYSLYLWHWPLIVLAPFVLRDSLNAGNLTFTQRAGVLVVALVLAHLSKVFVEDRGRTFGPLARSTKLTFVAMVAGMVALAVMASTLDWTYNRHVAQSAEDQRNEAVKPCHGASALVPGSNCAEPFGPAKVVDMGPANEYWPYPPECKGMEQLKAGETTTSAVCDFSAGTPNPKVVWLVGDSHAEQWQAVLVDLARKQKWTLKTSYLGGCPFAQVQFVGYNERVSEDKTKACRDWSKAAADFIAKDKPAYVFTDFFARHELVDDKTGRPAAEQYKDGVEPYWTEWAQAGARVEVLGDPPLNGDVRAANCVSLNPKNPLACAVDRAAAQPPDPLAAAVAAIANPRISYLDLTDYMCDAQKCYAVVGNVAVYYDLDHLNKEFSRSLRPMIAAGLGIADS